MIDVRQIHDLKNGEWFVSYVTLAKCGCRFERFTIKIKQKKEPTQKQIENAVGNKR